MRDIPAGTLRFLTWEGEELDFPSSQTSIPKDLRSFLDFHSHLRVVEVTICGKERIRAIDKSGTICPWESGCTVAVEAMAKNRLVAARYKGGGTIPIPPDCLECITHRFTSLPDSTATDQDVSNPSQDNI